MNGKLKWAHHKRRSFTFPDVLANLVLLLITFDLSGWTCLVTADELRMSDYPTMFRVPIMENLIPATFAKSSGFLHNFEDKKLPIFFTSN